MRKGFTLVELMVVIIILPFVLVLLDGLFRTLLTEMPRSWRIAQQSTTMLDFLEQLQQDLDQAQGLPAEFAGRAAGEKLLLIKQPSAVIAYHIEEDRIARNKLTNAPTDEAEEERTWVMPDGRVTWQVWLQDGKRYAAEVKTCIEHEAHGHLERKMARAHLFFVGAF